MRYGPRVKCGPGASIHSLSARPLARSRFRGELVDWKLTPNVSPPSPPPAPHLTPLPPFTSPPTATTTTTATRFRQGKPHVDATLGEGSAQISVGRSVGRSVASAIETADMPGLTAVTVAPEQTSSQNLQASARRIFFSPPPYPRIPSPPPLPPPSPKQILSLSCSVVTFAASLACNWRHAYLPPPCKWGSCRLVRSVHRVPNARTERGTGGLTDRQTDRQSVSRGIPPSLPLAFYLLQTLLLLLLVVVVVVYEVRGARSPRVSAPSSVFFPQSQVLFVSAVPVTQFITPRQKCPPPLILPSSPKIPQEGGNEQVKFSSDRLTPACLTHRTVAATGRRAGRRQLACSLARLVCCTVWAQRV